MGLVKTKQVPLYSTGTLQLDFQNLINDICQITSMLLNVSHPLKRFIKIWNAWSMDGLPFDVSIGYRMFCFL